MTYAEASVWIVEHRAALTVANGKATLEAHGQRASVAPPGLVEKDVPQLVEELRRKTGR